MSKHYVIAFPVGPGGLPFPDVEEEPVFNQVTQDPARLLQVFANHAVRTARERQADPVGTAVGGILTVEPPIDRHNHQVVTFFGWNPDGQYGPVTAVISDELFEHIANQMSGLAMIRAMQKLQKIAEHAGVETEGDDG
jgi:hypothetical protein